MPSLNKINSVFWGLLLAGILIRGPTECQQRCASTVEQTVDNAELFDGRRGMIPSNFSSKERGLM